MKLPTLSTRKRVPQNCHLRFKSLSVGKRLKPDPFDRSLFSQSFLKNKYFDSNLGFERALTFFNRALFCQPIRAQI